MGRGKVVLERIENKINRQVAFSKRRNGLLKKAYELSVLCGVPLALIIFSGRGKIYEFANPSISETIDRYRQYLYNQEDNSQHEPQALNEEVMRLKAKYESLQCSQRHLLGEDIEALNVNELQNVEKQLDGALSKTRQRKTDMMLEKLEVLRKKEGDLEERNKGLKSKLEAIQNSRYGGSTVVGNNGCEVQPPQCNVILPQPPYNPRSEFVGGGGTSGSGNGGMGVAAAGENNDTNNGADDIVQEWFLQRC